MRRTALVTGSSGLVGSETAGYLDAEGWTVHGVDNNMRADFFGPDGDTAPTLARLRAETQRFTHHDIGIRDREAIAALVAEVKPDLIVHAAAQPSHDLAARRPFDDFEVNALGTLNLLEAARQSCGESPFVFMSTNKVYGDRPNALPLVELETRWDYANATNRNGVDETMSIDGTLHSLFGVSKASADLLVQEYGRYFGLPTVCFRGGCLTGPQHAGVPLHGFLAYLGRAVRDGLEYRIFGHKGKQVRDNLHSSDVCRAIVAFAERPRVAAVYNLGGGRDNSVSMLEAIDRFEALYGRTLDWEYVDEPRIGDHICYISNVERFRADYPEWDVTVSLDAIFDDFASTETAVAP
jgi:CDP-paratose 2-epimerase